MQLRLYEIPLALLTNVCSTSEKMEISADEQYQPIKQDEKLNAPRLLKHSAKPWNYGMLPQTWENDSANIGGTQYKGDGDPLDVVELGDDTLARGGVVPVRVLGALALIDEGELDWKIITLASSDSASTKVKGLYCCT